MVLRCKQKLIWYLQFGLNYYWTDFPVAQIVKHLSIMQETWVWSPGREDSLEKEMATHFLLENSLSGKFHGWRSLVGSSPWDCKESDTTEQLHWSMLYQWSETQMYRKRTTKQQQKIVWDNTWQQIGKDNELEKFRVTLAFSYFFYSLCKFLP